MNWNLLLTASVVSALVSSVVGFLSSYLTLKYQRKSEKFNFIFSELRNYRQKLYDVEPYDFTPAIIRKSLSGRDMAGAIKIYTIVDDIYIKAAPFLDSDLQKNADTVRLKINRMITDLTVEGQRSEAKTGQVDYTPFWAAIEEHGANIIGYRDLIIDLLETQLKRLRL